MCPWRRLSVRDKEEARRETSVTPETHVDFHAPHTLASSTGVTKTGPTSRLHSLQSDVPTSHRRRVTLKRLHFPNLSEVSLETTGPESRTEVDFGAGWGEVLLKRFECPLEPTSRRRRTRYLDPAWSRVPPPLQKLHVGVGRHGRGSPP